MKKLIDMANGRIRISGVDFGSGDFTTASVVYKDYDAVFFGELNCDCDEDTRRKLAGIIISNNIIQEQVEVLWALTKDVDVVEMAAMTLLEAKASRTTSSPSWLSGYAIASAG